MELTFKSMVITICFSAALVLSPNLLNANAISTEKSWTMKEAVVFALRNSPDSRIATQRIHAAEAALQQAESSFQPRINLIGSYDQTDNPMYSFGNILNQGNFNNSIDFNNPGRTDNLGVKAELLYRIYNGGRDQAGRESAEANHIASKIDRKTTEHRLALEVVTAFQRIAQARDQVEARQAELKAINASLAVAKARFEAGDLLKTELLNFEVEEARISEHLIASKHSLELAGKIFLNLLGLENGTAHINDKTDNKQALPRQKTYDLRPEIAGMSAKISAAEAALRQAEGSRHPTLDGYASYQYDKGFVEDGSGDSWSAGLRLNYQLYDGNANTAAIAHQKAELLNVKEQFTKLKLAINLEIQEAELNYQQALERRSVTDQMVVLAEESAQLSRERFKEGVILTSDLIDVEVKLTDALVRQSAARTNYQIAVAKLRYAAGLQQFSNTTETLLEDQK